MLKKQNGVTLVALVITIIVLLILAGVTLAMVMGDSGIFSKANDAATQTAKANMTEAVNRAAAEQQISAYNEENNYNGTVTLNDLVGDTTIFANIMDSYGYKHATTLAAGTYTIALDSTDSPTKATVNVQQDAKNKATFEITMSTNSSAFIVKDVTAAE